MIRGIPLALVAAASLAAVVAPPAHAAKAAHVVLRWEAVPGAAGYELEIARDPAFSQVVVREKTAVTGYRWRELPTTVFHWRVRSVDGEGRASPWSEVRRIAPEVAAPRALRPSPDARVTCASPCAVELTFEPQPLIERFVVEVARTPDFKEALRGEGRSNELRVELPALGQWYWRGTGVDVTGRALSTGEPQAFVVTAGAPSPLSPTRGSVLAPGAVTLSWGSPDAYRRFEVEVRAGGGQPARHEVEGRSLPVTLEQADRVQWRVRGIVDGTVRSDWSGWSDFDVAPGAPTLVSPAPGASFGTRLTAATVTLEWTGGAVSYVVQLSPTEDFAAPGDHPISGTRLEVPLPVGRHFWRVIPEAARGIRGAPSEARALEVKVLPALAIPTPVRPVADDVFLDGQVTFEWSTVEGAVRFELAASGPVPEQRWTSEGTAQVQAFATQGEYQWRVRALDGEGAAGPWSPPVPFFVGPAPAVRAERVGYWPSLLIEGEETRVKVALYDRKGRRLSGVEVEATVIQPDAAADSARPATARPSASEEPSYEIAFVAPPAQAEQGETELQIRERGFVMVERLMLGRKPNPFRFAAQVGVAHNLGAAAGAWVGGEARMRLPLWNQRLGAALRVGTWGGATDVPIRSGAVNPTVQYRVVPATLGLFATQRLGTFELHALAGAGVQYSWLETEAEAAGGLSPTGVVGLGAARKLGPGVLQLDASLGFGRSDLAFGGLRTGALIVSLGYGVEP